MAMIVKMAQVESVNDDTGGLRIKVRTKNDRESYWAFPLLPKQFQVVPKIGEGVLLFSESTNKDNGNRYYLGPIISQPQFNEKDIFDYGRGTAISLLQGKRIDSLPNIKTDARTNGSFPNVGEVAMVGRESEDMIMRKSPGGSDELTIRCGIRKEDTLNSTNKGVTSNIGKIIFNDVDPAYIQLKYKPNLSNYVANYDVSAGDRIRTQSKTNSAVNIVADKINLIGVSDNSLNATATDNENLIKDSDMEKMMSELHQLPKGDILVKCLKVMKDAILNHSHPWADMKPYKYADTLNLDNFDLNTILSDYVRIS